MRTVEGRLRRRGVDWVIESVDGTRRVDEVDEPRPGGLVGRKKRWIIDWKGKRGLVAILDGRSDEQRGRDDLRGKVTLQRVNRASGIRIVSGGAPGLGRSRRGES